MLTSFRQFLDDNKDEIEALQVLYSVPYRAGLKFRHVKELAAKLNQPPFFVDPKRLESLARLWQAFEVVGEPDQVRGKGGKQLVDLIALVRHAIDPNTPLAPVGLTVEERYQMWIADKQAAGVELPRPAEVAGRHQGPHRQQSEYRARRPGGSAVQRDRRVGRAYELFGDKPPPSWMN
ncbi:MAG: type I restriction-modification enzyme R subunit C-terminal domain-containing protein [Gemmataceae bacterium]